MRTELPFYVRGNTPVEFPGHAVSFAWATDLGLSHQTVKNYVKTIYEKLQVRARAEAIVWARKRGMGLA